MPCTRGNTLKSRYVFLLMAMAGFGGCFRDSKPDQFYMLQAIERPKAPGAGTGGPLVGLGPIKIPAYLDRPQIVTAASGQQYHLSESHRWAERLDENIARVSAQNLAELIPSDRILMHPWPREPKPDAQLAVNIQEMHVDPAGQVRMSALWSLKLAGDQLYNHRFSCQQPASLTDYSRMVEVESECLARLNREMAAAIQGVKLSTH